MSAPNVYRDKVKEGRADYFVTYQPADCRFPFATLDLVFPASRVNGASVVQSMEQELDIWLKRYPVPVMVSAFDAKEDLIPVHGTSGESHLMGYCDLRTGQTVRRWRLLKDNELPPEQADAEYLQVVYRDVGFRDQGTVRDAARRENRNMVGAARAIVFFMVTVPVLIEVISHFARILSLTVRLYANMFAGELVTLAFFSLVPVLVPVIFVALHLGVAIIQTFIFVVLAMVYLGGALAEEH